MRNEFDDELGREDIRKRKRGFNSKPDPSDEDYYLDDDYENYQEQKYDRSNQAADGHDLPKKADDASVRRGGTGERTRSADLSRQSSGDGQAAFRGQSSSVAGPGKSHGAAGNRAASGDSQRAAGGRAASGDSQRAAGGRAASGDSQRAAGNRVSSGDSQRAAGNRVSSGDGQRAAANRTAASISQGAAVSRTASGNSQRTAGGRAALDNGQGTAGSRTSSGNSQSSSRGQIVIGDGGTKQQQRVPGQDKSVAASRSAAQAGKKRKIRRIILMVVLEIFTLAGIFAYAYVARLMGSIQRPDDFNKNQVSNDILSPIQKQHMTGYRTIAIFGLDGRDGNINKGSNSDLIMICNINRDTGEIRLVSVYRDTYMSIGEGYSYNKINAAYANGGAAQALAALNRDLDLDITEFVTFNWKSVADGINMLGGVDIEITKPEFRYINSFITETVKETGVPSVHLKSAGMNHLDGVQAVAYARLRKMDTDFQRTERQRLVIEKTFEKAKKADLGLLNRILLMEVDQIGSNLTFSDFTELLLDIGKYHIGQTGGFPFTRGDMTVGKRGDCVIPQTLESNVSELHKLLFDKEDYEPSDMVKKISAKIAADTGMYKQGSTSTNNTKDDDKKKPTETTKPEKTTAAEESSAQEDSTGATDGSGKPGKPTDSSESSTGETKETRPGESKPSETTTGSTKPGETKPLPSTSEQETTSPHGPGPGQTTAPNETTAPQTTSAGPGGGPGETTASHPSNSTTGGNSDVPIVVQPPT
ncbi:LCP family protein [Lacrimispora sp.]|uniref:LCP family protein n=1 Tax=Lacrimispora sp. TaxID=2719234 RepID=UPI002855673D|nr:LCP family protein [Lacrimispora sp.]MDR7815049.1 LCP family protein [Lacrimispora sp.]